MEKQGHIISFLQEQDGVGIVEIILILVAIFTQDKSVYKTCIW